MALTDFINFEKCELKDKEIISALRKAADYYSNGEISESMDLLAEIYSCISVFERWSSEVGI